eukprot:COSAG02_NODE_9278_length_2269_cov_1.312903_2_plen_155_part_00
MLRSAVHVCRPLPGAHASSQATEGLQHVNMKAVERQVGAGRNAHERLVAHPLMSRPPRKPKVNAAGAASVESVKSTQGHNKGVAASFSFSGAAQGFAPQHTARGGLASTNSAAAGGKRHHGHASATDSGDKTKKKKKKKKKKKTSVDDGRFSFK